MLPTPDPRGPTPNLLDAVLGPALDLEVWIPKTVGDTRVMTQRPLQLPTTVRRTFGAAGTRVITPAVEPSLELAQAAVKGGSRARNIRAAFDHLEVADSIGEDGPGFCLWACTILFGDLAPAVLKACAARQARDPNTRGIPGAFFAGPG